MPRKRGAVDRSRSVEPYWLLMLTAGIYGGAAGGALFGSALLVIWSFLEGMQFHWLLPVIVVGVVAGVFYGTLCALLAIALRGLAASASLSVTMELAAVTLGVALATVLSYPIAFAMLPASQVLAAVAAALASLILGFLTWGHGRQFVPVESLAAE